jgi:hypothetical protein
LFRGFLSLLFSEINSILDGKCAPENLLLFFGLNISMQKEVDQMEGASQGSLL